MSGYDVGVERLPLQTLFDLKEPRRALADWCEDLPSFPRLANTAVSRDGVMLCWVGPERWLLRAELGRESGLLEALRPEEAPPGISVVCVSDTLAFFRVTGADADQVMAIACPLDLHASVFGADAVSWTEAFGQKALVMRCAGGFDLAVEQSFGAMVADYFDRALA